MRRISDRHYTLKRRGRVYRMDGSAEIGVYDDNDRYRRVFKHWIPLIDLDKFKKEFLEAEAANDR